LLKLSNVSIQFILDKIERGKHNNM